MSKYIKCQTAARSVGKVKMGRGRGRGRGARAEAGRRSEAPAGPSQLPLVAQSSRGGEKVLDRLQVAPLELAGGLHTPCEEKGVTATVQSSGRRGG